MLWKGLAAIAAIIALALPSTAVASRTLDVSPQHVKFGKQTYDSFITKSFTVKNKSSKTVSVSIESSFVPDDFSPGQPESTCPWSEPTTLAKKQSCRHVIGYYADSAPPFAGPRRIELAVVARDLGGQEIDRRVVVVTAEAVPPRNALDIDPRNVRFGRQPFETFDTRTFTITNTISRDLIVTIEQVQFPDDFSDLIDSTCVLGDTVLAAGATCTHVVGFRPTSFFSQPETAQLRVTARDVSGGLWFDRVVTITGKGF